MLKILKTLFDDKLIKIFIDSVIRTSFYKYFDPKESLISDGIINRSIITIANSNSQIKAIKNKKFDLEFDDKNDNQR